ncbi:MAG: ATP phosphoribosyltransferase [Candidatus Dormiibacterota bacterium]
MRAPSRTEERVRLAVPSKGRLSAPALTLVREAGLEVDEDDRRLFAPCRNFPLDVLFVRAEDIPEYTQDGVVDLGVTGTNLVEEAAAVVDRGPRLGFGACRLQVAVPNQGDIHRLEDVSGRRVATSHPRLAAAYFKSHGVEVRLIPVSGSVEATPVMGVADAIVDLVASGSTLARNGLRPLATILESEAELVLARVPGSPRAELVECVRLMLASVVAGRGKRYVMMNAPRGAVPAIRELLPGMAAPSILPLADPTMVAIHVAIDVTTIWQVLAPLRATGASSILVLPIEQFLP